MARCSRHRRGSTFAPSRSRSSWKAIAAQTHRRFLKTHLPRGRAAGFAQGEVSLRRPRRTRRGVEHAQPPPRVHRTGLPDGQQRVRPRRRPARAADTRRGAVFPRVARRRWHARRRHVLAACAGLVRRPSSAERPAAALQRPEDRSAGEMRRIARFLDIPIDESKMPAMLEHCSLDYMRRTASQHSPILDMVFQQGGATFFNKGTNGRWKDADGGRPGEVRPPRAREPDADCAAGWPPASCPGGRPRPRPRPLARQPCPARPASASNPSAAFCTSSGKSDISCTCRTSMISLFPIGARLAHSMASSRDFTWIIQ